ncbi:uncharacterized protein EV154DRAFT_523148 [Mucor mucedo]|uniref:uncharacterized protein n=1 Tax=Mucor mucedo TaxID=29922 RepID=UPI00221F6798|nr:uncharacterized protein EV154DRAFT_523148 [Mucor mucedo]KAI7882124.1 hypothetical protein EV154DRAFT_523148 [Mucor mucedo]
MLLYFVVVIIYVIATVTTSSLQGSHIITPQDYYGLPAAALANSPPACGMPYNQLNLARITAVQNMNTGSTCNLCLKIVNSMETTKFIYVLAVDLGGNGLDLSVPAFEYLFDQGSDPSPASWSTVNYSFCIGVYTPGKVNPNQGVHAGSIKSIKTTKQTAKAKFIKKKEAYPKSTIERTHTSKNKTGSVKRGK